MEKLRLSQLTELKEAILHLPQKEKDKLLIRLINKDQMLIKQLHFQLLENEQDLMQRHLHLEEHLHDLFKKSTSRWNSKQYNTQFQLLLIFLRELSGKINEHAAITKSKDSELKLRIKVVKDAIAFFPHLHQENFNSKYAQKYFDYQKGRLKLCFTLLQKMHEDLRYEFKEDIKDIVNIYMSMPTFQPLFTEYECLWE